MVEVKFAAIIGLNPSRGARSPMLWNAAFHAHQVDATMVPIDVLDDQLSDVLKGLAGDRGFLGGAIAVPYKGQVRHLLGEFVDMEAHACGSVNVLYRDLSGRITGANTDGIAAQQAVVERWPQLTGCRVLVLGLGGVGRAVSMALSASHAVVASSRHGSDAQWCASNGLEWVPWTYRRITAATASLIVNCTSLGSKDFESESTLSVDDLRTCNPTTRLFDVIYHPSETRFLRDGRHVGLETCNGSTMNLYQAALAFNRVLPHLGLKETITAMKGALVGLETQSVPQSPGPDR